MWQTIVRVIAFVGAIAGVIGWITIPDDAAIWQERFGPVLASMTKDDFIILLFCIIVVILLISFIGPHSRLVIRRIGGSIARLTSTWDTEELTQVHVAEGTQQYSTASTMSSPSELFFVDYKPSSKTRRINVSGVVATGRAKAGHNKFCVVRDNVRSGSELGYYEFDVFVPDKRSMITRYFEFEDAPRTTKNVRYSLLFHPADSPQCVGYINSSGDNTEKGVTKLQVKETREV